MGELPLHAGREARAAAAAQARLEHLVDDLLGRHLEEHLLDRLVAVARDVVLDLLGVDHAAVPEDDAVLDHAAVPEDDAVLFLVERDVRLGDELLRLLGIVAEALDDAPFDEVLCDDLLHVFGLDLDVERALREDLHDRTLLAEAETAGRDDLDLLLEAGGLELVSERLDDLVGAAGAARSSAADQYV